MSKLLISVLSGIVGSLVTGLAFSVFVGYDTSDSLKNARPTLLEIWDTILKEALS